MLQDGPASSQFGLEVGLQGINGAPGGMTAVAVADRLLVLLP
jgi:hypothetical protein